MPKQSLPRDFTATQLATELEAALLIDKFALDEALTRQPELYYHVSEAYVLAQSRYDAAKQALAEIEAERDIKIRQDFARREEKCTETMVKNLTTTSSDVKAASDEVLRLKVEVAQLSALQEAFSHRGHALRELVALYTAGYFGDASAKRGREDILTARAESVQRRRAELPKAKARV